MRTRTLPAIVFLLLVFGATTVQGAPIVLGTWGGHQYVVVPYVGVAWPDARSDVPTALGPNYDLAAITSQEEQNFLAAQMSANDLSGEFWLGAYQDPATTDPLANWNWVTGEAWSYTSWAGGEPNDYYGSIDERYAGTWSQYGWNWNDEFNYAYNIKGYIAESVPDPASTLLLFGTALAGLATLRRRRR